MILSRLRDFARRPKDGDNRLEGNSVLQAGNGCFRCDIRMENGRIRGGEVGSV